MAEFLTLLNNQQQKPNSNNKEKCLMSKQVESHILNEYLLQKQMGSGAYGHVWQVQQKRTHKRFALKKVFDAFRNSIDAQRTYREVSILKQLNHDNIVKLYRVIKSKNKKDLYLVFQFMEADLHSIVGSNILQKMHQVYVFYQVLKALKYLHSAQLIHRDLKPSNVLLNSQCKAKICDFGLVRTLNAERDQEAILSEQVATKWYRAPELLLGSRSYKKPIDVWSFGCIVAEILIGKPMFAGDSTLNQLEKIMEFTGEISLQDIESLDSPVAEQLITQIKVKKRSFREYFSSVDPDFWVLLKGTLEFNPNKRMTIDQVLQLQIFDEFRSQIQNLKVSSRAIRPQVDDNVRFDLKVYRDKIYQDIDKTQNSRRNNKKLTEIQNISKPHGSLNIINSKKPFSSQEKKRQYSSKIKSRQYSTNSNPQNKNRSRHYSQEKDKKQHFRNTKILKSDKSLDIFKKKSPYKAYLNDIGSKIAIQNNKSQIINHFYHKSIIPKTTLSTTLIKKISQPFIKNKDKFAAKKEIVIQSRKSGKILRKVSSAKEKCFFGSKPKDVILSKIGFG